MKTKVLGLVAMFMMTAVAVFAADKTESFKVYGNCSMCETRIEAAAGDVEGVSEADWDVESKMLAVTFDDAATNVHAVHMAVTEVGHDTEMHKADDEVYNNLPACCKYERVAEASSEMSESDMQ